MNAVHPLVAAVPAFAASLVEFVEALTVVLAVGVASGWRASLSGAAAALVLLALLLGAFGRSIVALPQQALELAIGTLLLLFGVRWLRKATLRAAGVIPQRDEQLAYERVRAGLAAKRSAAGFDTGAAAVSFNAVLLEGLEVVFIVVALGAASGSFAPAVGGALAAGALVCGLGVVLHRPLVRVPENTLKLFVGVMLCGFGTLWAGEGCGVAWPLGDASAFALIGGYALVAAFSARTARRAAS